MELLVYANKMFYVYDMKFESDWFSSLSVIRKPNVTGAFIKRLLKSHGTSALNITLYTVS